MRSSRPLLPRLALALFALYLAGSVYRAADHTMHLAVLLQRVWGESPFAERSRTYGPAYAEGIEVLRRTIPRDGAYALVNGAPEEKGGPFWIKYDLAPRRAVFLGEIHELGSAERLRGRMPRAARWVVIAYGPYRRPVLMERYKFIRSRRERRGA